MGYGDHSDLHDHGPAGYWDGREHEQRKYEAGREACRQRHEQKSNVEALRQKADALEYKLRSELTRLRTLEVVVKRVLTQKADDVCWRDVYTEMAALVGVKLDPGLLPREKLLGNCAHFYDCLAKGEPYRTPE